MVRKRSKSIKKTHKKNIEATVAASSVTNNYGHALEIFLKIGLLLLSITIIGLPINTIFDFSLLIIIIIILITTKVKNNIKLWGYSFLLIVLLRLLLWIIPDVKIQEGHNYFTYVKKGELLEQKLPTEVFQFGKDMLQAQYKLTGEACVNKNYCWGNQNNPNQLYLGPKTLYAFSSDSVWQNPKYSRVVSDINFTDQNSQRANFLNTSSINWIDWYRDVKKRAIIPRSRVPQFVLYEFPQNTVGGELCWQGYVAWQQENGKFKRLYNKDNNCHILTDKDINKQIYGFSIIHSRPLKMQFTPPFIMSFFAKLQYLLKITGLVLIALILLKKDWKNKKEWINPIIMLFSTIATVFILNYLDEYNQLIFSVHQAGNDGLTYASYGREMLQSLLQGDMLQFLRGEQDVFYFMPGLRYFRAIELIIFGATNFGYILMLLLFVLFTYKFIKVFLSNKLSIVLLFLFISTTLLEVFGFSLAFYEQIMLAGFPGTAAYAFLLMGFYLIFSYFNKVDDFCWYAFWAGLAFALAIFVRPNLALMLTVFLILIFILLLYQKRYKDFLVLGTGFSFILLVPLHNFYFGGKLVALTSAAFISANFITPPAIYWQALQDFLSGENTQAIKHVTFRWSWWLEGKYQFLRFDNMFSASIRSFLHGLVMILSIIGLFYKRLQIPVTVKFLVIGIIVQHISMFMWRPSYRYSAIIWMLTFIVSIIVVNKFLPIIKSKWQK